MYFKKLLIIIFLTFVGLVFSFTQVHTAELFFGSTGREVGVGQSVEIGVFLNTQTDSINAIEGEIYFPSDMFALPQIRDANSIISLWVEKPHVDGTTSGKIIFSGIVPGGYQGDRGLLFSFVAQAMKRGPITVSSLHETILRSDGSGTAVSVSRAPLTLKSVDTTSTAGYLPSYDPDQPESFVPKIGHDPNLFDGKYFVAFTTQDKGSGIAEYQVAEEHLFPWQKLFSHSRVFVPAESPYVLRDQTLRSTIYIKAIDNEKNERVVEIAPTYVVWYEKYFIWCILGVVILCVFTILIRLYGGKKKN